MRPSTEAPMHLSIPIARRAGLLAGVLGLSLMAAGPAFADHDSDDPDQTTCGKGEVWDSKTQKCVKAENRVLPDKALTDYAEALIKAHRYQETLSVRELLRA